MFTDFDASIGCANVPPPAASKHARDQERILNHARALQSLLAKTAGGPEARSLRRTKQGSHQRVDDDGSTFLDSRGDRAGRSKTNSNKVDGETSCGGVSGHGHREESGKTVDTSAQANGCGAKKAVRFAPKPRDGIARRSTHPLKGLPIANDSVISNEVDKAMQDASETTRPVKAASSVSGVSAARKPPNAGNR